MYSLVLMTALTTTPDAAEFNGYFRDLFSGRGCYGSSAPPRYSCYGGYGGSNFPAGCSGASAYPAGCSGSYSSGCSGCNGCNGDTFLNRVRRWFDRGDCCGGTGSGYGCSGSRYGCGGTAAYSCFGSTAAYSCFGGPAVSYTPVFNGGQSCYGGPIPSAPPPIFDTTPPFPPFPTTPGGPPSSIPYAPPEVAPGMNPQNTGLRPAGYPGSALVSNNGGATARATVIVRLPADARLFADARPLSLTGPERKFVSPELPADREFTYRFRAEYERDGETVSVTKKVPVRAGGTVSVEFTDLTAKAAPGTSPEKNATGGGAVAATPTSNPVARSDAAVAPAVTPVTPVNPNPVAPVAPPTNTPATDRASITVKVPPGATLYVDDRRSPSTDLVRQFSTPQLPAGREFAYLMKLEVVKNGQTETYTQKVPFRAGERVEVDFSTIGR
jgi:uncharacterized protein (TIGR03000 family)